MIEDTKKAAAAAGIDKEADRFGALKAKYGKIYLVTVDVPDDAGDLCRKEYLFKRPTAASYDRLLQSAPGGQWRALKILIQDNLLEEYQDRFAADLEDYPGLVIPLGQKLLDMLGANGGTGVKKL